MFGEELPPPPPAYSEQEFDRKISAALEVSLTISQPAPAASLEDEEWEEWDEVKFNAAVRASQAATHGSGSTDAYSPEPSQAGESRNVAPLKIHKKSNSNGQNEALQKPRPSWYDEAGLGGSSASSNSHAPQAGASSSSSSHYGAASVHDGALAPTHQNSSKPRPSWFEEAGLGAGEGSSSSAASRPNPPSEAVVSPTLRPLPVSPTSSTASAPPPAPLQSQAQSNIPQPPTTHTPPHPSSADHDDDEEDDRTVPPPPFTPVGPSLDGPPFEEVAGGGTLTYNGHDSPPPSPLTSPVTTLAPLPTLSPLEPSSSPHPPMPEPRLPVETHTGYAPVQDQAPLLPRQSMPPPARPGYRLGPRPATMASSMQKLQLNPNPQVDFNPSVAYGFRNGHSEFSARRAEPAPVIDATAFYK
ncbi:hypothetical protein HGRIS_009586 [Hohenbuehelia grisea]|uniref:Uncharacterized protein n=1 Tax=Hohenbuehelia grisea TaxID=104357 RepID=A0ABR3J1L9_9AGAR